MNASPPDLRLVAVHDIHPPGDGAARWHVDREATKAKRDQMRAERLAKAAPAEESSRPSAPGSSTES